MKWVVCTDMGGNTVYVNLAQATRIEPSGGATMIHFEKGHQYLVREDAYDLMTQQPEPAD